MSARRDERVRLIQKIIRENRVTDQKMLLTLLNQYGTDATQATISRDLRLMGISKKRDNPREKSYYVLPQDGEAPKARRMSTARRMVVPSATFMSSPQIDDSGTEQQLVSVPKSAQLKNMVISGPFIILRTQGGYAQVIAKAIDDLHDANIVATLAGYDTVLLIPSETATREMINRALSRIFPELF